MDWKEHYEKNTVSAGEAVQVVKSGDTVALGIDPPDFLISALAARREDLKDVHILSHGPDFDPGWLQPGWDGSFPVTVQIYMGPVGRPSYSRGLIDYYPMIFSHQFKPFDEHRDPRQKIDVFVTIVSPPDEHGFCSFGAGVWDKRRMAQTAETVIAEVDASYIRTYGTNYIHVSEIARFVENTTNEMPLDEGRLLVQQAQNTETRAELERILPYMSGTQRQQILTRLYEGTAKQVQEIARQMGWVDPPEDAKRIAEYVSDLIRDGDTIQIGVGTPGGFLPTLGAFDDKKDLGWHSEMGAQGVIKLIERGVINGCRKTINRNVAVFTGLVGCGWDEIAYAADNPLVELRDAEYVVNIRTAAAHDNMVSINNAIAIDLSGQINSETIGARLQNGTGGQTELHIGAVLSRGGRAITLLRSTAAGGTVSRIVAQHEQGAVITIPRTFADIVVTEYGVARLLGKSIRERARELIAIAHPDFRKDLQKLAERLYYP
ncbi:MAG: acetyl-CoA hydrolase/transferase C-terminal domain-containing protein [Dehalococcoidia bacterium]